MRIGKSAHEQAVAGVGQVAAEPETASFQMSNAPFRLSRFHPSLIL